MASQLHKTPRASLSKTPPHPPNPKKYEAEIALSSHKKKKKKKRKNIGLGDKTFKTIVYDPLENQAN
jgi:hypothetical protein